MEKVITFENLRSFAYVNEAICTRPIRGIVLSFFGLGNVSMFSEDTEAGIFYAQKGILYVVPYNNPWAWMNHQAVSYTDEILDVLFEALKLPENLPVVSTGGSMGGLSALTYMYYAKRTPVACVANCPVCDLPNHFTERPDLPRTLYSAFRSEEGSLKSVLEKFSPLHLVNKLPKANYYIFHCTADKSVNKGMHSDRLVPLLEKVQNTKYYIVPDRGHCDLTDDMKQLYLQIPADEIDKIN